FCAFDGPWLITEIVNTTLLPGTAVAGPVLISSRSAEGASGTFSVSVFGNTPGSGVVELTVAVLLIGFGAVYPAGTEYMTVTEVDAPAARVPIEHGNPPVHGAVAE